METETTCLTKCFLSYYTTIAYKTMGKDQKLLAGSTKKITQKNKGDNVTETMKPGKITFDFKKVKNPTEEDEPYPDYSRPTREECNLAVELLSGLHGLPTKGKETMSVLDSLVRVILSQNTTDKTSRVAFLSMKKAFPTYREVYDAVGTGRVEDSIRHGGLADRKAYNIHMILAYLLQEHPEKCEDGGQEPSYEWLRDMDTNFCKMELLKHKGVGPKSVSCVLMFNLHRDDFPVDTHVWHISKMMKWAPAACNAETCYTHMNARIPPALKYPFHVLLVEHGKRCPRCAKNGKLQLPEEGTCPLVNFAEKLEEFKSRPQGASMSPSKEYVPWYVKTEGCEMIKEDRTGSSSSSSKGTKRKIKTEPGVKQESAEEETPPAASGSARRVKIKQEPGLKGGVAVKKEPKLLQHLDMQSGGIM